MNTLGEYQNNITGLSALDLSNYERIFKVFTDTNNSKDFYFYNILKKIELPINIDSEFIDFYKVESPLPLTILSHKIYNDIKLWWLIFLLNKEAIGDNIFVIPGGTQIKYLKKYTLAFVYNQITNSTVYNGKHY